MRRFRQLGRGQAGYTLIELLLVMVILAIVLVGLSSGFVSGTKSELDLNHRDHGVIGGLAEVGTSQPPIIGRAARSVAANAVGRIAACSDRALGVLDGRNHGHDDAMRADVENRLDQDRVVPGDSHQHRHGGAFRREEVSLDDIERHRIVLGVDPEEVVGTAQRLGHDGIVDRDDAAEDDLALAHTVENGWRFLHD